MVQFMAIYNQNTKMTVYNPYDYHLNGASDKSLVHY